jgi:adhesin/invasin
MANGCIFLSTGLRHLAWLNIILQAAFPLMVTFTPMMAGAGEQHFLQPPAPLSAQRTQAYIPGPADESSSVQDDTLPYSGVMSQGASMLSSGHAADSARSLAVGEASAGLQQWLSDFGTARIQLNMDRHGSWSHSSGDLLFPLYDNGRSLLFVQGGIRKPSDRLTGNLGYGVRTFWQNDWMFGGNVFYDNDFTGHNRRVGIGGEAWRDYIRLSANTYLGTTDWHTSRDFDGTWQEKPADGYDIRAEGWLPAYPRLGAKLEWEQYYGSQVALFDKDHLQSNPHAITAGVEYTPLPLITLGAEQRQGRGLHDTQFALGVNWSVGQDWHWQLDPANVQAMRTLAGSRYDLVNRNNEIVLQYRKNPAQDVAHLLLTPVTDNSPADGVTRNVLQVLATFRSGQPVRNATINWLAPSSDASVSLAAASSVTDDNGQAAITLTSTAVQVVPVTAQSSSVSATQNSHFVAVAVSKITLDVTRDNAVANGSSTDTVVATLTDGNGRDATGQKVTWTLPDGVLMKEASSVSDGSGKATVHLTSTASGSAAISAAAGSQTAEGTVHFTGDNATATIGALAVTTDGSPADGKTADVAQVTVTDANGNSLSGQAITWKADKSTVAFGQSAVTDSSGKTTVTYTDTTAESLTLTATLTSGSTATAPSLFVSDKDSARLKDLTVTSGAKASGTDTNAATVTVTDANGSPLVNTAVTFSVTGSAKLAAATVNTGSNGQAQVTLTDTEAETVQVTAKLASGSSQTKDSSFVADLNSAVLIVTATTGALSDGSATNAATVTLKDKNGSALAGQSVTLSTDGSAKLSATSGTTDSNGQVQVTLTDTVAETVKVTAGLNNGKTASAQAAFIAYTVTALTASATSVKADGSASSTLTATVTDTDGTVVANTPVAFTVTGSATLSAATVSTDSSGQAQVTLTDTVGEAVTVTAKAKNYGSDAGKTQSVTFVASSITAAAAYGTTYTFTPGQGFPQTGFAGAKLYFLIDGSDENNSNYTWSSNQSWVTVDSSGDVTMNATQSSTPDDSPPSSDRQVTITGTPKTGGTALTYTFTIQKWYKRSDVRASVRIGGDDEAAGACDHVGTIESASDMSDGAVSVVGKLFGEWRDSPTLTAGFYWDTETTTSWRTGEKGDKIAFIYRTGVASATIFPGSTYTMCRVN